MKQHWSQYRPLRDTTCHQHPFGHRALCYSLSLRAKTPDILPLLQHEVYSHRRHFSTNFSNASPSHGLPFSMNCSSMGHSHGAQSFRNRLLQRGFPIELQVLPINLLQHGLLSLHRSTGPGRSLLQHGLLAGSQPPSGTHLLQYGVLNRLQVDVCSTMDLHELQGDSLPHHGLQHKLQGKYLCSGTWSTSSPLLLH